MTERPSDALIARFWAKVRRGPHCYLWTAGAKRGGYGLFSIGGRRKIGAHRFAWELSNGAIPDGLQVCHVCDTPACVRLEHLFLGTNAENAADMDAKGRRVVSRGERNGARTKPETRARGDRNGRRTQPERFVENRPRGEMHGCAKLTATEVIAIRAAAARAESLRSIARRYGIGKSQTWSIVRRERWSHV